MVCPSVLSCSNLKLHQTLEVKNTLKQENIILQLTFTTALTLTGFRTTRPCSLRLFPSSCSTLWGLSYEQEIRQGHQCRQSGRHMYLPRAEHGEPYVYLPLLDCIVALEHWGSHAAASTLHHWSSVVTHMLPLPNLSLDASFFHYDTKTISGLFAVTLSSLFHDFTV